MSESIDRNKNMLEVVKEAGGVIMVQGVSTSMNSGQSTTVFLPPEKDWVFVAVTPTLTHALWRPPHEEG